MILGQNDYRSWEKPRWLFQDIVGESNVFFLSITFFCHFDALLLCWPWNLSRCALPLKQTAAGDHPLPVTVDVCSAVKASVLRNVRSWGVDLCLQTLVLQTDKDDVSGDRGDMSILKHSEAKQECVAQLENKLEVALSHPVSSSVICTHLEPRLEVRNTKRP